MMFLIEGEVLMG